MQQLKLFCVKPEARVWAFQLCWWRFGSRMDITLAFEEVESGGLALPLKETCRNYVSAFADLPLVLAKESKFG